MKDWNPRRDLDRLLDALTDELLTASAEELLAALIAARRQPQTMIGETRRLVQAAEGDSRTPGLAHAMRYRGGSVWARSHKGCWYH
jgi:hypothetical protein